MGQFEFLCFGIGPKYAVVSNLESSNAFVEVGSSEGTAEESPPAGRVMEETDYFRLADHPGVDRLGQHHSLDMKT